MKRIEVTGTLNGKVGTFEKVSKPTARKMYLNGIRIYMIPCMVRFFNVWISPVDIEMENDIDEFDKKVNAFEYYNCGYRELGAYASFYINKSRINATKKIN